MALFADILVYKRELKIFCKFHVIYRFEYSIEVAMLIALINTIDYLVILSKLVIRIVVILIVQG